ncbi:MAG: type II CRISPR RNA-guided endonuclease Cas9, partial [bacterium]
MSCEEREGDQPEVIDVNLTGSRIFEAGTEGDVEAGKDESRAKNRRSARLSRRQTNRRAMRTFDLYRRLQSKGLLPAINPQDDTLTEQRAARDPALAKLDRDILKRWSEELKKQGASDEEIRLLAKRMPYLLRARALDEKLPPLELGRAIYHLGQRRGFQSNRKGGSKDDEEKGKVKAGIKELNEQLLGTNVRTLGELFARTDPEEKRIRQRWTSRDMYKQEFEQIWKAQQKFYPDILNDDFKKEIHDTIFDQRPLKSQSHLIGECEHEPGHKRAPIACLLFQRFRILQNVNNLRITSEGITRQLSDEERKKIISALEGEGDLLDEKGVLTFAKIKKNLLGLKKGKINFEKGNQKGLIGDRTGLALQKIFKEKWDQLDYEHKEKLVDDIMSIEKNDALIRRAMNVWGLDEAAAKELAEIELEPDHCGLSRLALKKLIPRMEQGEPYMTAVANTYDPPPPEPEELLPPVREALKELKNPVVERSLTEMRKVVNAIIREHGKPAMIRIELARDIRNPRQKRKEISDRNSKNEKERENAAEELKKGIEEIKITAPNNREILKYRLWKECNQQCPYTGKMISAKQLFGRNSQFDIEHIIPFSRSLENSFINKTLCENNENKNVKGNKTPWETYGGDEEKYSQIIGRVKKFNGDAKDAKLRRFQMKDEELKEMMADFSTRQLNDTRYASKLAVRYLSRLYGASGQFKTPEGKMMVVGVDEQGRRRVQVCAGMVTAHIRNELGLRTIWNSILEETYPKLEEEEESREPQSNEKER